MNPEDELLAVVQDWDRAMVQNDAEAIGRFMADDWTIVVPLEAQATKPLFSV